MTKTKASLALALLLASTGLASAEGKDGAVGIGAEAQLNGIGGLSVNFNTDKFHIGGFLGFLDPSGANNTEFAVGARFFYHVHNKSATADFSVGGGLGIHSVPAGPNDRNTELFLEPSFQVRAFIVPNVALSFTGGFAIGLVDASGFIIGGQVTGVAGVHYYFF